MRENGVTVIAEAGVNHNGDIELAKKLIDVAAEAGADYVKFQTFKAEKLVSATAKKATYQEQNYSEEGANTQFGMLKKLELDKEKHYKLISHAASHNIKFLSTPFDLDSVDLLHQMGIKIFKVPSGEITNQPLLKKIASLKKPVIISTGMCDLSDIEKALAILNGNGLPSDFITVLHCNTEYPTPMEDVNLLAMQTIAGAFKVKVGYSDHTLGIEIPIAATALGASIIEKHFTLDKSLPGPDHKASLEPNELKDMILAIRNIERAMGSGIKKPSLSESKNIPIARKSIHLNQSLPAGHILVEQDLIMKRPGDGISPMELDKVVGTKLLVDLPADHQLNWRNLG